MKTFASVIVLLSLVLSAHSDGVFPIKNGKLQNPLNANGQTITNAVDLLDANGNSLLGAGPGGGISLSQGTNIVNGATGVIQTNGSAHGTTFIFSSAGTNAIGAITNGYPWSALYDPVNSAHNATNSYPWGPLYDPANTALAATNAIGIANSPLAAFVNTNRFASSNVATASLPGIVKVDGSTITAASDGTISAVTGGSGNVTGAASSSDLTFAMFQGTSGKILTNRNATGTFSPASFDAAGAAATRVQTNNGISFGQAIIGGGATNTTLTNIPYASFTGQFIVDNGTALTKFTGNSGIAVNQLIGVTDGAEYIFSDNVGNFYFGDQSTVYSAAMLHINGGTLQGASNPTNGYVEVLNRGARTSLLDDGNGIMSMAGITNSALTANTLLKADANKRETSLANGAGALTNNGSGGFGWDSGFAHTNRVSASSDGLAPKLPNDATKYLDGTGAYSVPSGGGGSSTYSATLSGTNVLANLGFGLTNHFLWNLTNANNWLDATNFSVAAGASPARVILELHSTNSAYVVNCTSNLIFGSDITGISVSTNTTFVGFTGPFPGQPTNGVRVTSNVGGYAY